MKKIWKILIGVIVVTLVVYYALFVLYDETVPEVDLSKYGPPGFCEVKGWCGDLVAIDCQSEVDGPYYYVDISNDEIVGECGGFCDRAEGCPTQCPPSQWVECYAAKK